MSLDDQDVSQLLPVRGGEFDQGVRKLQCYLPPYRCWAYNFTILDSRGP